MQHQTRCPVCDSLNIGYRFQAGEARQPYNPPRWSVFGCDDCGLTFVNPRPTWEELADYHQPTFQCYNAIDQDEDQLLEEAQRTGQFRHIPIPVGKSLLDVGCGGGSFLRVFKQMGVAEAQGVEPSEAAAAAGRACGTNIFTGTLEQYVEQEGCDRKFDVITCSHVLGSTPEPVETLSAMQKLLAPDGYIAIFVPNYACAAAQELSWRWHSFDLPYNLIQYTPKNLAIAGERAGLMVRRHYTYSLPEAVANSICLQRRHRWATPYAVTRKFLSAEYVRRVAADLDSQGEGEAIMMEFCHPYA